mmetsp:Transcript_31430/g.101636  ORF Transcript_31430/g.101636 Transcript_31430/m.101636 type:complete len:216 (-) Transcript_31430:222-869(-)
MEMASLVPSSRTPYRPASLAALTTVAYLELSSGLETTPSIRITDPISSDPSAQPAAVCASGAGGSGGSEGMPFHPMLPTSATRGAACTASIHSSRCASHATPPCSHPTASPDRMRARSRRVPASVSLVSWKPSSMTFISVDVVTRKPLSSSDIDRAAPKTPPGSDAGSSTRVVTISNLFLARIACLACASWYSSRATDSAKSAASASIAEAVRKK